MKLELVYKLRNYRTERNGKDYIISEEYDAISNQDDTTILEEDIGKDVTATKIGKEIKQDYIEEQLLRR